MFNVVTGLGGTQRISLPMFAVLRRFSILLTLLGEWWLLGANPSSYVKLSVFIMIFGSFVAASDDLAFDLKGYVLIMLNNILTAFIGVYTKKKLDSKELGTNGLIFYNSLFSLPVLLAFTLYFEPNAIPLTRTFPLWNSFLFDIQFLLCCVMGLVLNYATYFCTQVNSALTTCVVGCLKVSPSPSSLLSSYAPTHLIHSKAFSSSCS
eukprot:m.113959 g.113959  ORF g.113959 m.113959 type:complete len:207 (+) comp51884_c0_seq2:508-1128(+)